MCARSKIGEGETASPAVESKYQMSQKLKKQKRKAMQQHQSMMKREPSPVEAAVQAPLNQDLLALSTVYYRRLLDAVAERLARCHAKCQDSKLYRILFYTTQPAHVVTLIAVTIIATLVCPTNESTNQKYNGARPSTMIYFIYLVALMMHFGAQMWMTFVSGLTLYFAVPRHIFGVVQIVLFPKYFGMNTFLSAVTLFVFVKLQPAGPWDTYTTTQIGAMVSCFFMELIIRLYLTPPLLRLIAAKNAIETAAGVGLEIGKHDPGPLAHCPHYIKIHCMFRKVHMFVAMGNVLAMACTVYHIYYLASKICIV